MSASDEVDESASDDQARGKSTPDLDTALYKNLIENAPVGLYRTTSDGRILYANPYLVCMMGYDSLEQLQKRNLEAAGFHEGSERSEFKKHLKKTGKLDSRESVWIKRDGSKFYVVESARIVEERPDGIQVFEGFAIDITARKLAEIEIQKSERKYRELFEGVTDGIVKFDTQGRIIEANKAFIDMLGYSSEELLQLSSKDIKSEEHYKFEAQIIQEQVIPRGYSDSYEINCVTKTGIDFPYEMITYAVYDLEGNPDGTWSVARNLTLRNKNRQALEKSRTKLLEAQKLANIGNWEWEMETGAVEMSPVGREIYGFDSEMELSVDHCIEAVHPDDRIKFRSVVEQTFRDTIVSNYEYRIKRPDNTVRYIQSSQAINKYNQGNPSRVAGTIQDITKIKNYQIALEKSQAKLLDAQEIGNIGNWEWDMPSGKFEMSAVGRTIYGFEPDQELTIRDIVELIHPDCVEDFKERIKLAQKGIMNGYFECWIVRSDKTEKFLHFKHIVSARDGDKPTQLTGTIQDITEVKQYQIDLEESQAKLLEAQEIGRIGNWEWDLESDEVYLSEIARSIYGFDPDIKMSNEMFLQILHPEDAKMMEATFKAKFSGIVEPLIEFRVRKDDSSYKHIQSRTLVSRNDSGKVKKVYGTVQDITEIKQYQVKLEQNQKSLEESLKQEKILSEIAFRLNRVDSFHREINSLLLETSLIIEVDQICLLKVEDDTPKLNLMYCSNTLSDKDSCGCALAKHLTSIDGFKDSLASQSALVVNDLDSCDEVTRSGLVLHNISSLVALPISIFDQVRGILIFSNGENSQWCAETVRFLKTLAAVITSAWSRDMHYHAQLEAEQKNRESARLLAQSSRLASLGVMAGGIAHEINQPLNAIRLTADSFNALSKKGMLSIPDKYLSRLQKISDHVCRIDVIIQKMRHLWSPISNINKEDFDINAALERATSSALEQFKPGELQVEFDLAEGPITFFGNPLDMDQIVINLLNNSREALAALPPKERKIRISSTVTSDQLHLRFEDNGVGFGSTDNFQLFDPFYSTKRTGTGMGLGLPIVKKIVENNSGSIVATNIEPRGAALDIILQLTF